MHRCDSSWARVAAFLLLTMPHCVFGHKKTIGEMALKFVTKVSDRMRTLGLEHGVVHQRAHELEKAVQDHVKKHGNEPIEISKPDTVKHIDDKTRFEAIENDLNTLMYWKDLKDPLEKVLYSGRVQEHPGFPTEVEFKRTHFPKNDDPTSSLTYTKSSKLGIEDKVLTALPSNALQKETMLSDVFGSVSEGNSLGDVLSATGQVFSSQVSQSEAEPIVKKWLDKLKSVGRTRPPRFKLGPNKKGTVIEGVLNDEYFVFGGSSPSALILNLWSTRNRRPSRYVLSFHRGKITSATIRFDILAEPRHVDTYEYDLRLENTEKGIAKTDEMLFKKRPVPLHLLGDNFNFSAFEESFRHEL